MSCPFVNADPCWMLRRHSHFGECQYFAGSSRDETRLSPPSCARNILCDASSQSDNAGDWRYKRKMMGPRFKVYKTISATKNDAVVLNASVPEFMLEKEHVAINCHWARMPLQLALFVPPESILNQILQICNRNNSRT